jgi:hypothetical protein
VELRVGDRLLIECAPHRVRVDRILGRHVSVEWPWGSADPDSRYSWNGAVAVPCDPSRSDWHQSPWRLEPRTGLSAGDYCEVSIPPTEVVVLRVQQFEPPLDIGWLPRPHSAAFVAAIDSPEGDDEAGFALYLDRRDPIKITHIDG